MSAIQNDDAPNLENLLDVLCADVNAVANNGYTALIISAYNGQKSAVKLLIERGANVNAKSKDGYTALIYAAFGGHAKIVEELVQSGAAVNSVNEYGANALIYAAHKVTSNRTPLSIFILGYP